MKAWTKKLLALTLALVMILGAVAGCNKQPPEETKPAETKPAETEPAETEPAETEPAETEPEETFMEAPDENATPWG